MRRLTLILVMLVLTIGVFVAARGQPQQFRGQVVNRDNVPQRCQVDFYYGNNLQFGAATDPQGYFFVDPKYGNYRVVVSLGNFNQDFAVTIDQYGLRPSTLVVRW